MPAVTVVLYQETDGTVPILEWEVLAHGVVKERRVHPQAIETAIARRNKFVQNPGTHTYTEELT